MADTLITNLTSGNPVQSGDEIPANRGGSDVKLAAGSIAALASLQLPIQDGQYYTTHGFAPTLGNIAIEDIAGVMLAIPVIFVETKTWTKIGAHVSSAGAADVFRLAIYSDSDGLPGSLIVESAELSCAAAVAVEHTISQSLTAGTRYWLAWQGDNPTNIAAFTGSSSTAHMNGLNFWALGFNDPTNPFAAIAARKSRAYGAFPASFGTIDFLDFNVPLIWLRTGV